MVRFIEENTKHVDKETENNSTTDVPTVKKKVLRDLIINNGGGLINSWVDSMRACSPTHLKSLMKQSSWLKEHPSALDMFEEILHASERKQIVMFLDYDGTLSPIVDDPDRAFMSKQMRRTVRNLANCFPTAIVSGRCREKVYNFVKLTELYYAGSHGMDIKGPEQAKGTAATGCKRELQFMLKSQSEICGGESLGRTRGSKSHFTTSTDPKGPTSRVLRSTGIKKMRLITTKDEDAVMSDSVVEEDEEEKSDVVDVVVDERNGSFCESVKERSVVLACPASFSELAKLTSRTSCRVKLKSGGLLGGYGKPGTRLTRSMLKPGSIKSEPNDGMDPEREAKVSCKSEAKGDEDHRSSEKDAKVSEESCVDAATLVACGTREDDPIGLSLTSGLRPCGVSKAVKDRVDKPLSRLTRSLVVKQESDLENNTESSDLGKVDVHAANDVDMDDFQNPSVTTPSKRGRPRKFMRNFPAKLKELFDSRILEGLTVYYLRCAKMREAGARGLKGVIKGSGVLCFCCACKGTQVVSPAVYEHHASSINKRSTEYILLESGFTLRDVMNACKETPFDTLEEKLRGVVGPDLKKSSLCFSCQGPMIEPRETKSLFLCKSCLERKEPELPTSPSQATGAHKGSSNPSVVPKTILDRSISSARQSNMRELQTQKSPEPSGTIANESKSSSIKSNSHRKLTRKDLRLHKLVFEDDVLPDGTEVAYFVAGKKLLVGYKKGFGIHCSCCNKVVSPSAFEAHAGCASRRKPFQHIYTTNGVSLHELSVALSKDEKFSIRENDDICRICQDGGELLCCDTCPRSYHIACAGLSSLPSERWSCQYCVNMIEREKCVESNRNAVAAGRVRGVDAIAQIATRCIRIVSSLVSELPSVCVLCRGHSFCRLGFSSRTVILCDQCEKEFHVGCLKDHNIADLKELPKDKWFCSPGCKKINTSLGDLIVQGEEKKLSNNFLNFIRKKQKPNEESCPNDNSTPNIRWRILSGKLASSDDTKEFLKKALSILHERFDPICESGTRGDLIPAMVYGKKAKGHDFSGMYCTMLTVELRFFIFPVYIIL